MMPTCGTYSAPAIAAQHGRQRPHEQLVRERAVAEEHQPRLAVAHRGDHAPSLLDTIARAAMNASTSVAKLSSSNTVRVPGDVIGSRRCA
jgi:hypothetical protein